MIAEIHFAIFGRLLCGIAAGINSSIVPLIIREMSPTEVSGFTGTLY